MMRKKLLKYILPIGLVVSMVSVGCGGCQGCGASKGIEDVDAVIADTPTPEPEATPTPTPTPEADISTLDTSMAGTFYVIAKDGIPYFAEDDESSEVLGTFEYDTEVTSQGMSVETHLFKIESEDGTQVWVSSEYLDTVRGGYNPNATPTPTPDVTQSPETPSSEGTDSDIEIDEEFKEEIGKTIEDILDAGIPSMSDWLPPDIPQGDASDVDWSQAGQGHMGDGSSWTGGTMTMD